MKRTNFKPVGWVCLFALVFSLTNAIGSKRFVTARYKDSGSPTCNSPVEMPGGCTALNTGVLCTTTIGSITRTWYRDLSCVNPYYQLP